MCNTLLYPCQEEEKETERILAYLSHVEQCTLIYKENHKDNVVQSLSLHHVDLVLLHESLMRDKEDILHLIDVIVEESNTKVIVISEELHAETGLEYYQAGAVDYLLIDELDSLSHRMENAVQDCVTMPMAIATQILEEIQQSAETIQTLQDEVEQRELKENLTEKEIEMLKGVAQGLLQVEIAEEQHLSLYTVKTHLNNARRKLGVKTTRQAVEIIKQLGL